MKYSGSLLLGAFLLCILNSHSREVAAQPMADLGMTMNQVKAEVGTPDQVGQEGGSVVWAYRHSREANISYLFEGGLVSMIMALSYHSYREDAFNQLSSDIRRLESFGYRVIDREKSAVVLERSNRRIMLSVLKEWDQPYQYLRTTFLKPY